MLRSRVLLALLLLTVRPVVAETQGDGELARVKQIGEISLAVQATGESSSDFLTSLHYESPGDRSSLETVNGIVTLREKATGELVPSLWQMSDVLTKHRDRLHLSFRGTYRVKIYLRGDGAWVKDDKDLAGTDSFTYSGGGSIYESSRHQEIVLVPPKGQKIGRSTDVSSSAWVYSTPECMGQKVAFDIDAFPREDGSRWFSLKFEGFNSVGDVIANGKSTHTYTSNTQPGYSESQPWNLAYSLTLNTFNALLSNAQSDKNYQEQFEGILSSKGKESASVVRTVHYTCSEDVPEEHRSIVVAKYSNRSTLDVTYSVAMNVRQSPAEVEIVPEEGYDQWLPEAGANEITGGNTLSAKVRLVRKDDTSALSERKARFKFKLLDTSQQPGICCNRPKKEAASDTFDFKIEKTHNSGLEVADGGQSAETAELAKEAAITVTSMDYGAFANLEVTAFTDDGQVIVGRLKDRPEKSLMPMPRDDNNNYIADAWEKSWKIYDRKLPPDWNGSEQPKGQRADGDGVSVYEKYRGFFYRINNARQGHGRLDPNQKHLFVYDAEMLMTVYEPVRSFVQASKLKVLYIDPVNWTGQGSSAADKRIVNFNHDWGHAIDQHAIHISTRRGESATPPFGWQRQMDKRKPGMDTSFDPGTRTGGVSFPDGTDEIGPPVNVYEIIIYPTALEKGVDSAARLCLFHGDKYKGARDGADGDDAFMQQWMDHYDQLQADKLAYDRQHPSERQQAFERVMAVAICHELGHSTGAQHHKVEAKGERQCYMIQNDLKTPPPLASDPYFLRPDLPKVQTFCRDARFGAGGRGCFSQLLVNDDPKVRNP